MCIVCVEMKKREVPFVLSSSSLPVFVTCFVGTGVLCNLFIYSLYMYFYDPFGRYLTSIRLLLALILPRSQRFLSQASTCGTCVSKSGAGPGNSPECCGGFPCQCLPTVNSSYIEQVQQYKYLGSIINDSNSIE